ncbi:MAG: DDE-type integrase/transposase/recombinase [Nitrosomonas sp.]|nr:DDE-type integrase/transposase/recombinase [Nitrosomonas sp.]
MKKLLDHISAGWLYLVVVLDMYSHLVVSWSMQNSLEMDALKMAWFRRQPKLGLIFNSNRGSQYCSHAFQNTLAEYGMQSSMSRKGTAGITLPLKTCGNL